jgi:hypothetical protein
MSHLHPIMKSPMTAKASAQKNEIQSHSESKGGASGMEFRKDGRAKMRALKIATLANSACGVRVWACVIRCVIKAREKGFVGCEGRGFRVLGFGQLTLRNSKKERENMRRSSKTMMSQRAKMTNPGYSRNMNGLTILTDNTKEKPSAGVLDDESVISEISMRNMVPRLLRTFKPNAHLGAMASDVRRCE